VPLAAFGELGLTGELRHVAHVDRRMAKGEKFRLRRRRAHHHHARAASVVELRAQALAGDQASLGLGLRRFRRTAQPSAGSLAPLTASRRSRHHAGGDATARRAAPARRILRSTSARSRERRGVGQLARGDLPTWGRGNPIDARTNEVTRKPLSADHFFPFAVTEGHVWFTSPGGDLAGLNAHTFEVEASLELRVDVGDATFTPRTAASGLRPSPLGAEIGLRLIAGPAPRPEGGSHGHA
jgi:hypothetical protein